MCIVEPFYDKGGATIYCGDNLNVMKQIPDNSVDTIVTDPPYGLSKEPDIADVLKHWLANDDYEHSGKGFMNKSWDSFVPGPPTWRECYRVLKPGGTLLCFASTRTFDLMAISLRLAGFEMHPFLVWIFSSGFPKATSLSKMLDRDAGKEREIIGKRKHPTLKDATKIEEQASAAHGENQWAREWNITTPATETAKTWDGWCYGKQTLKPAMEPILMVQKQPDGRMVDSCKKWGVAGLWVDGGRVPTTESPTAKRRTYGYTPNNEKAAESEARGALRDRSDPLKKAMPNPSDNLGRWPSNLIHSGEEGVVGLFPDSKGWSGQNHNAFNPYGGNSLNKSATKREGYHAGYKDQSTSAARFFYCAKASKRERTANGTVDNNHSTVKPLALMQYLCRLTRTPTGGIVLDPFMGSGSTLIAALAENRKCIGIEQEEDYCRIAVGRLEHPITDIKPKTKKQKKNDPKQLMFNMGGEE